MLGVLPPRILHREGLAHKGLPHHIPCRKGLVAPTLCSFFFAFAPFGVPSCIRPYCSSTDQPLFLALHQHVLSALLEVWLPTLIAAQWSLLRHDSTEPSSHPMLPATAETVLANFASGAATAAPSSAIDVHAVERP